jgi:hypothetical protein
VPSLIMSAPDGLSDVTVDDIPYVVSAGTIVVPADVPKSRLDALELLGFTIIGNLAMTALSGQFTGTGASNSLRVRGDFNVSVWPNDPAAPVIASFHMERSFDNGVTWLQVTLLDQDFALVNDFSTTLSEPEANVSYRLVCDAFTGGAAKWRISY